MTHFSYMAEQPNERTNEENEASSLSPLQNCRLLLVARSVAWVMISPAFLSLRRGGRASSREVARMTPTLPQPVSDGLDPPRLSFFLPEGAVLCRSAARSLSRIRLGGKSNFFPLTQSNSAAVAVAQHSLPPLLLPRAAVVVEAGSEGREEGRREGKHTSGGN